MITYFIPVYNEANKNLREFLKILKKKIITSKNKKFIIVDDGSTDETTKVINNFLKGISTKNLKKITILKNKKNKGIGFSFKRAIKICNTKYICPIPSDNDYPFMDEKIIEKKGLDFVMYYPINSEKYTNARYFLSMMFRIIFCVIFNLRVNYIQGSFIAKTKMVKKIKLYSNRFTFWPELNVKMLSLNLKFTEIPIFFKNKSTIDRTVSLKNFFEIFKSLIWLIIEIHFIKKKIFKNKSHKVY